MPVAKNRVKGHLTAGNVKGYLVIGFLMALFALSILADLSA